MIIQGFNITFKEGGWGWKPVVNGITLCESFSTQEEAIEWLKGRNLKFERSFAIAQDEHDNMSDE